MNSTIYGLKRVLQETFNRYKLACISVLILIIVSAFANVYGSMFLKTLIDDYITPMLSQETPDFNPLIQAIMTLICIYIVGILSTYAFNRIMVTVSLGTLKSIRDELFEHMETLPIKFFDTHAHGDIMSIYTNDTDTLRQLLSQSLPQMINSLITMISVFISMLILNIPLAIVTLIMGESWLLPVV